MKYRQFTFEGYLFDASEKTLSLHYCMDDELHFTETYRFDFEFVPGYSQEALRRAFELLHLVAGVSYYKTYIPAELAVSSAQIDGPTAHFLSQVYQKGLGEFFYINQLDPASAVTFPTTGHDVKPIEFAPGEGLLIGLGGGKDSLVSTEILRGQPKVATWSLNHRPQLQPLVERVGLPHFYVEREWDQQLRTLNAQDAYNGHIPISAIFACVGVIVAILSGYRDVVVSNESSASEPNLHYQGVAINHQYSKSLEFEQDFQATLSRMYGDSVQYYSFLRPLSELRIAELFAGRGFDKYHDVFSSCNRAFTHNSDRLFWDGVCAKCAFVFLALTPFVQRERLEELFSGKNLLLDPSLEPTYRQLLGIEGDKPLECVGEVKESRAAMRLATQRYPELAKYRYDLPANYDYRALAAHSMPKEAFAILRSALPT
ncbi:MAG TPA: hypothetical protein VLE74_00250 [Candidatus Saccharimonadales bacterium]|nr:hypothetical protein [Candidatus Saccharimonadales bacterium]